MSTEGVKPLFEDGAASPELQGFVTMARADGPSQADLDRLAERLGPAVGLSAGLLVSSAATLGTPPLGVLQPAPLVAAKVSALGKLLASTGGKLLAVGLSLGVGAGLWALRPEAPSVAPVAQVERVAPPVVVPTAQPVQVEAPVAPPAEVAAAPRRVAAGRGRTRPAKVEPALPAPSELSLIQQAEAARGQAREALAILARHEQLYPNGALAQEREALAIELLLKSGQLDQARTRAARFEAAHPRSAHLSRLRTLLDRAARE